MKQDVSGVHVFLILWKAANAVSAKARSMMGREALGDSDFRVLEVLLHKGPMPVNTIGPKVHLTPGSISVAVDRLYAKGLVSRVDSEEDRRVRIVDLTPEGRKVITKVFQQHTADLERITSVLNAAERETLIKLLKKLGRYAESL